MPILCNPTKITHHLGITYPIIQAGMVWVSGAKLAAASSEAGCLGVLGAGSLTGELLSQHIHKVQKLTKKPFAVNFPIMYHGTEQQVNLALQMGVKIFIMSAGSPKVYTKRIQQTGAQVWHVTSSPLLAKKCEDAGVDGVIVEGFEAGGHNGRDELTTLVLVPQVKKAVNLPVVAAGGIASGEQMLAAMALGADGVQIGSRFATTVESSAHEKFKQAIVAAAPSDTHLMMKKIAPVRLLKNHFYQQVLSLEQSNGSTEELLALLGKGRAKAGMHEGDLTEGELEIGQVSGMISDIPTVAELVTQIISQYEQVRTHLTTLKLD
ncbi:MAG: nitronate monooxygenase [Proteobacteria bacterium]|nr:nitronate monooxygenase [Pseudomonadota bacterium]